MTEKIKNKWREASVPIRTLVGLSFMAVLIAVVAAYAVDTDLDSMDDNYETIFSVNYTTETGDPALNYTNAADAALNYDSDSLVNSNEYAVNTDPFSSDTDRDGFNDGADDNPTSRAYIDWGEEFWLLSLTNDTYDISYTQPEWLDGASKVDGDWDTNALAWYVDATNDSNVGSLCIDVDRNILTNDVVMSLTFDDTTNGVLYIGLLDSTNGVITDNLLGNIIAGTGNTNITTNLNIELSTYTNAVAIAIGRNSGEIRVYDTAIYIDEDGDGLDKDQETQYSSSDALTDTDSDTLSDYAEVITHGSDPTLTDTDSDGYSDSQEVAEGSDPANASSVPSSAYEFPYFEGFESSVELTKQIASDGANYDYLGWAIDIYNDTIIAGAYQDDDNGANSGCAYIFEKSGTNLVEQAIIRGSDTASGDNFAYSVAVCSNRVVAGAPKDEATYTDEGTAFIFRQDGTNWVQEAKLTPSTAVYNKYAYFGHSVDIDGDTCVVGAKRENYSLRYGAAYVFVRSGTNWTQEARLQASDKAYGDYLGESVAISGSDIIAGSYGKASSTGAAYVFVRNGTNWTQQAKLTASDGASVDFFGWASDIRGDRAIVGAHYDDDDGDGSGSAYIFRRDGTNWTQEAKLTASDAAASDRFGCSVAIYDDLAIVGAYYNGDNGALSGSAYIFARSGTNWNEVMKVLPDDGASTDYFGQGVSIHDRRFAFGAYGCNVSGYDEGAIYVTDSIDMFPIDVNGQKDWVANPSDSYVVSTNEVYAGATALSLQDNSSTGMTYRLLEGAGIDEVWEDYYSQPPMWDVGSTPLTNSSSTAIYCVNTNGQFVAYDGALASNNWVTLTNHAAVTNGAWYRVTVKQDFDNEQWSLWLDDVRIVSNMGFATPQSEYTRVTFYGTTGSVGYVDSLSITTNEPTGLDSDGDGMPNSWEVSYSLNPDDASDASSDGDSDDLTNLEEYQNGTDPTLDDTDGDGATDGTEVDTAGLSPTNMNYVTLTNVSVSPQFFNPATNQAVISYEVDWTSEVTIVFYPLTSYVDNQGGETYLTWTTNAARVIVVTNSPGTNSVSWDGRDDSGSVVTNMAPTNSYKEVYYYTIDAVADVGISTEETFVDEDRYGGLGLYDSSYLTNCVFGSNFNFSANEPRDVSFEMLTAGWVSMAATREVYTIIWGEPFDIGTNVFEWNGRAPFDITEEEKGTLISPHVIGTNTFDVGWLVRKMPQHAVVVDYDLGMIADFKAEPYAIYVKGSELTGVSYEINEDAYVSVTVQGPSGNIKSLVSHTLKSAGSYTNEWFGDYYSTGRLVAEPGDYEIVLTVTEPIERKEQEVRTVNVNVK